MKLNIEEKDVVFSNEKEKEKIRQALEFEFEALDAKPMPKKETVYTMEKEGDKVKFKKTTRKRTHGTKAGTINVNDIVSVSRSGTTFYGKVTKITGSAKGDKVWAFWNEDKEKAIKGIASEIIPTESADYVDRVELVEKGDLK